MPFNNTQSSLSLRGLLLTLMGVLLVFNADSSMAQSASLLNTSMTWILSEGRVVEMGETVSLPNGRLTTGYTLEMTAESGDRSLIGKGILKLNLTAFSPEKDSQMQKAGIWYIRGSWSLSDVDAPPVTNPRYTPGVFGGQFQVELPFNPAQFPTDWSAGLRLPQTTLEPIEEQQGRQPLRGNGILVLNDRLDGELTLDLKLWPRI